MSFSSNENGELKTIISPLFGLFFLVENFSIKILSLICNSGSIDPEGIYLGSRIKVLQDEIKKANKINGIHSLKISLFEILKIDLISFLNFRMLFFKISFSKY